MYAGSTSSEWAGREALDELERDEVLKQALGSLLANSYIAVKRNEAAFFKEETPEEEARQHFYKY